MAQPFSGAVLAGGRSSRFGTDKARFVYRGKPLLAHVLNSLAAAAERFIVANSPYPEFGVPIVADLIPGAGSMSGLHSALVHAKHDWVALAACDLPHLTPAYWELLLGAIHLAPLVIAEGPHRDLEPLAALYHRSLLPLIEARLARGDHALFRLAEAAGAYVVTFGEVIACCGQAVLTNANRPDDLT
jgi:molybdopterin-guanine dinucleotide biosynthesis protein A